MAANGLAPTSLEVLRLLRSGNLRTLIVFNIEVVLFSSSSDVAIGGDVVVHSRQGGGVVSG